MTKNIIQKENTISLEKNNKYIFKIDEYNTINMQNINSTFIQIIDLSDFSFYEKTLQSCNLNKKIKIYKEIGTRINFTNTKINRIKTEIYSLRYIDITSTKNINLADFREKEHYYLNNNNKE